VARGERVVLTRPRVVDGREFLEAVAASRALHEPWVNPPSTPGDYRRFLARGRLPDHATFLARARSDGRLVGVVNVSNIVEGSFRSAHLGYYGFRGATGTGLMTEALALVVDHAFGPMGLHRLEANVQPGNTRSRALAQRLGFRREGFSPRYLEIGGAWRDHDRFAITAEEWRRSGPPQRDDASSSSTSARSASRTEIIP
jgi:ribosomal-protein-alanine N-acetyltransferase